MKDLRLSQTREVQIEHLTDVVGSVLSDRARGHRRKLLLTIQRSLRQFHLDSQLEESDIPIDAYIRTRTRIEAGECIENIPAWLNRVSFNIIREASKKRDQCQRLTDRLICNDCGQPNPANSIEDPYAREEDIEALFLSLHQLSQPDLELLMLRVVKGLSWQEISQRSIDSEEDCKKPRVLQQRLRKRGERALKRLRDAFISIRHNHVCGRGEE